MAGEEQPSGAKLGQSSGPQRQLRQDRLVEALVPDPSLHQPGVVVTGFLGKGVQAGDWRLYLTPELNEYIEFSEQDVAHTQPLSPEQSSIGGTRLWLRAGAAVRHTHIEARQVQADFLQGGITSGFMPGTSPFMHSASRLAGTGAACTRNHVCSTNPHIPACQIRTEVCGSAFCPPDTGPFCPTGAFIHGC